MASSSQRVSASLSSIEPSAPRWKYDVFLSFRGIDTRKGITFELYDALNREGIKTFMDDQDLPVGATISPSLLKAIEESRFAIIVLSRNYASSSWCLEELTKIVDCMKDDDRILPLFYHVEPTNVRYQKRSFAEAFTEHEEKSWHATEKLKKWRDALQTVANFSGWDTHNYKTERELVEVIVKSVCNKVGVADITKNLQTEVDKLRVAKDTVAEKVSAAEAKGEKILKNVQDWLNKVDEITKKAQEFLKDEIQATEEPNDSLSHRSKKSLELLQVVTELYEMREFSDISYVGRAEDACLASPDEDYEKFDSRVSTLEKIMKELASSSTDMVLVYGIGGVGKTTLAEQVLRQAQKQKLLFDDAIMLRDVKIPNVEAIQNQIADKLGLKNLSETSTLPGRADKISDRIKDKKTLVILDDVWGEIDLKAVGLPHIPTCRILLTSRSQQVFSINIKQKEFPLGVLHEKEAWNLFKKKAGDVVADPAIEIVATQVAQKCGGLPVFVITVARALENKPLPIWKNALKSLEKFDEKGDLTQKAYSGIEWSYMQLGDQELRSLFLLCGTTVQGNYISLKNLLRYSIGLSFFEDHTVEEALNALCAKVDKLKSSCLLLEGDDDTCVRMHDLVHYVAKRIAGRDQHVLVEDSPELKKWPNEDFFNECTKISLLCCNIATLPGVPWECPKLEMFHLHNKKQEMFHLHNKDEDDENDDMPSNFFEEMKKLRVLGLNNMPPISLPQSLQCLKNLQTLCLDGCMLEDIALVGELKNLQILSIVGTKVKQLPKEIGQLTRLRLLDLSYCHRLEVISPGVISNLTSLEDLRMRNSFDKWQGTKEKVFFCPKTKRFDRKTSNNASLSELKKLSKLTALEIWIRDANILPPDLFSDKLERYQIFVGFMKDDIISMYETTCNTLELQFTATNELDRGLKMLLEKCHVLCLNGNDGFDFACIINTEEVMFNYLTTLTVYDCDALECLSSSSVPQNFKKLKYLEIYDCVCMEQIISTREHDEEHNMFGELESLKLYRLPNLARFCTGKSIEFPLLEELYIWEGCVKLGAFVGGPMIKSSRKEETRERDSEEKFDAHSDGTSRQYFIFDEKVRFPILEILHFTSKDLEDLEDFEESELQTIWHNQLAPGSFGRLREVQVEDCESLKSIFPPSMMERLSALETLTIRNCESVEVVFDERGETNVNETHGTSSTQLKDGQNLISVQISYCGSLKNIFPASMATGCLQQLQQLSVSSCREMENIVAKEEGGLELTTPHPKFVFPKVTSLGFSCLPILRSFYPELHTSKWPLLEYLNVEECDEVEFLAAELSIFQERHPHAPTKQPLFLIDQDSFPVLEELDVGTTEIFYGQSPAESIFSRLKSISFKHAALHFLQKLHSLESLEVCDCPSEEIFVDEGNSSGEIHAVRSLPRVRNLNLSSMDNLMHLGKEKHSQPVFPNLEFLFVKYCHRLKNLESSAISFQNLTALEVLACDGLECLIPYSIAKCLVRLTKMEVRSCRSIVVIVASNGEDDAGKNEIAFRQLQHLTLKWLPCLQGFCSGNCNVKLPSSLIPDVINCPKLKISPDEEDEDEYDESSIDDETAE